VQIDAQGNVYVAGFTSSLDFPTTAGSFEPAPLVPLWSGTPGGFVAKLSADATQLGYSTYVPAAGAFLVIAPGSSTDLYVASGTGPLFPVTASAPQPCFGGGENMFVAHLGATGALLDSTNAGPGTAEQLAIASDGSVIVAGTSSVSHIRFGDPGWIAPACLSPAVVNSATFQDSFEPVAAGGSYPSPSQVAPGELITLTGLGIGPQTGVAYQPDAEGNVPTTLGGVQVLFDGVAAPMFYAQSGQVNAQAPFNLAGKTTSVTLQYNGMTFGPLTLTLIPSIPGLFRLQPGVSAPASAVNQDGNVNGPSNPASPGSVIALWGTGFGPTDPACATGGLNTDGPVNLPAGTVVNMDFLQVNFQTGYTALYAGSAPTLVCGITQINVQIPTNAPSGALSLAPLISTAASSFSSGVGTIVYVN
jgi:uncharacterized protein (TIGR03437 family)